VVAAPHAGVLAEALDGDVPPGTLFLGDGAQRHRAAIESRGFQVAAPSAVEPSIAAGMLEFLRLHPEAPAIEDVAAWEPRYLREPSLGRPWME